MIAAQDRQTRCNGRTRGHSGSRLHPLRTANSAAPGASPFRPATATSGRTSWEDRRPAGAELLDIETRDHTLTVSGELAVGSWAFRHSHGERDAWFQVT